MRESLVAVMDSNRRRNLRKTLLNVICPERSGSEVGLGRGWRNKTESWSLRQSGTLWKDANSQELV